MGTSRSSSGPGSSTPLVPSWADSDDQTPLPLAAEQRFKDFRTRLGRFVSHEDRNDLTAAVGHYARTATGGRAVGHRRFGAMMRAGGVLFDALSALRDGQDPGIPGLDLDSLTGRPVEEVIDAFATALLPDNGDADRIRAALIDALSEALEGMVDFDPGSITDEILVDMILAYVSQCIFEQIVLDSRDAFAKAADPAQIERAENALRELVRAAADMHLAPLVMGNVRALNGRMIEEVQRQAIAAIWAEWEAYEP